jgi:WD40 repeat protein/serine/threonine protein kinase
MSVHQEGSEPIKGYRLVQLLGGGEFGSAWRAEGPDGAARFLRFISLSRPLTLAELNAVRKIKDVRHPRLEPVHGVWVRGPADAEFSEPSFALWPKQKLGELAIACDCVDETLAVKLRLFNKQGEPGIPLDELLRLIGEAAEAIDFLNAPIHDLGNGKLVAIYHCDIQPATLIVTPDGSVQVSDFASGRISVHDGESSQSLVPVFLAPPANYSPPELILGESDNTRTDQYSLAVSYYKLRTGRLPCTAEEIGDTVLMRQAHLEGRLRFGDVPEAEAVVLRKATALDPAGRFASATAMVSALRDCVYCVLENKDSSSDSTAPSRAETPARGDPSLRILVIDKSRTVFTESFNGAVELGRQSDDQENPYSKREISPSYWRAVIAGIEEHYISRRHLKLELVGEELVRVTNLSTKVRAWSHAKTQSSSQGSASLVPSVSQGDVILNTSTTRDLSSPLTLIVGSLAVRVEVVYAKTKQTSIGGSATHSARADTNNPLAAIESESDNAEDLLRLFGAMTSALLSADNLPDLFSKVARAVVETAGMDTGWVLVHENDEWKNVSEHFSPEITRDPNWQPDYGVLKTLLREKRGFWVGSEQHEPGLQFILVGVDVALVAPILDRANTLVGAVYGDCRQGVRSVAQTRVTKQQGMLVKSFANAIETLWEKTYPATHSRTTAEPPVPAVENPRSYHCEKCGREWAADLARDNELMCTRKCGGMLVIANPQRAAMEQQPTAPSEAVETLSPLLPKKTTRHDKVLWGHVHPITCFAFRPDGCVLASGSASGAIRLWNVAQGSELNCLRGHTSSVSSLAFSPQGSWFVSGSWDRTLRAWDAPQGVQLYCLRRHDAKINGVAFTADGERVVSVSADWTIRVWRPEKLFPFKRFSGYEHLDEVEWTGQLRKEVNCLACTPDGSHIIVVSADDTISVWDTESGSRRSVFAGAGGISNIAMAPNGHSLAISANDSTIRILDLSKGTFTREIRGHSDAVRSVGYSPNGRIIVSGGVDATVRLWDADSGVELARLMLHRDAVNCVSFSPDGRYVASGGQDTIIGIWKVADLVDNFSSTWTMPSPEKEEISKRLDEAHASLPLPVHVFPWYLRLDPAPSVAVAVGQPLIVTLQLTSEAGPNTVPLQVPANVLELTAYVEAPGFHLDGEHTRTLAVVEGMPAERTLAVRLFPLSSGEQVVRLLVYPGDRVAGVGPAELRLTIPVTSPVALPDIPELLDSRGIPDPRPDVLLVVTLEETCGGERLGIHLSCPTLKCQRLRLDPPLDLTARDAMALRRMAAEAAAEANTGPGDVLMALQSLGRDLFQRLMPPGHPLRDAFWQLRHEAASDNGPRTWLILSDAAALLPWEFVCPWGVQPETAEVWDDDFLAGTFQVAHWVGRRGFTLAAEAPFGRLDLAHYSQNPRDLPLWQRTLGGEELVGLEGRAGHLALTAPGSPYHGLHLLRYNDTKAGPVTRWEAVDDAPRGNGAAETLLHERRLDFTRRRPIVGLSFVQDEEFPAAGQASDAALEAGWVLPILHAGASAVVGPRSPGSIEGALLFAETFYEAVRGGGSLGESVALARDELRRAFPERPDWLGYVYYGHPECRPYAILPAEGFTLFEALDHPENEPFHPGFSYRFRASYRSEAPVWFAGRLRSAADADGSAVSVMVVPLDGSGPTTYRLEPTSGGSDCQCVLTLTMPAEETSLPVLIRFERDGLELRTLTVTLDVASEVHP